MGRGSAAAGLVLKQTKRSKTTATYLENLSQRTTRVTPASLIRQKYEKASSKKDNEKLHFIVGVKEKECQIHFPPTEGGNLEKVCRSHRGATSVPRIFLDKRGRICLP